MKGTSVLNQLKTKNILRSRDNIRTIIQEFQSYTVESQVENSIDVSYNTKETVVTLTLNNLSKLNSLSLNMVAGLSQIIDDLESKLVSKQGSKLYGLILKGKDKNFCTGMDLSACGTKLNNSAMGQKLSLLMQDSLLRLSNLPLISIASLEGWVLGGGAELSTCCDYRVAGKESKVRFVHRNLYTVPGFGGSLNLVKLLGSQKALHYLTSTQPLKVPEVNIDTKGKQFIPYDGYFNYVVEEGRSYETALKILENLTDDKTVENDTSLGIRNLKELISDMNFHGNKEDKLDIEMCKFTQVWGSEVNLNAIQNFKKNKK